MGKVNLQEELFIKADIAEKMRFKISKSSKKFVAYNIFNTLPDNEEVKSLYANALSNYLSKSDLCEVILETTYGKYNNMNYWVDKIIDDIIFESYMREGYDRIGSSFDLVRGAFPIFIEKCVAFLSKNTAYLLLNAVLNNHRLSFLHNIAFYEKMNLEQFEDNDDEFENETDFYLALVDLDFNAVDLIREEQNNRYLDKKERAIKKRNGKDKSITSQMSFKHLLRKRVD